MERDDHLLTLAAQLRRAALDAGRRDVAAKADDVILLLTGAGSTPAQRGESKSNLVIRIMDGLGL